MFRRKVEREGDDDLILAIHVEAKRKYPYDKTLQRYHEYVKWIQSSINISPAMAKRIACPPSCLLKMLNCNQDRAFSWSKERNAEQITMLLCQDLETCVRAALLPGASPEIRERTLKRLEMHLTQNPDEEKPVQKRELPLEDTVLLIESSLEDIVSKCTKTMIPHSAELLKETSKRTMRCIGKMLYASGSENSAVQDAASSILNEVRGSIQDIMTVVIQSQDRIEARGQQAAKEKDVEDLQTLLDELAKLSKHD